MPHNCSIGLPVNKKLKETKHDMADFMTSLLSVKTTYTLHVGVHCVKISTYSAGEEAF